MVATRSTQRSDDAARGSGGETASDEQYPLRLAAGKANDRFEHSSDDEEEEVAEPEIVASETKPATSVHPSSGPRFYQTGGGDDETAAAASAASSDAKPAPSKSPEPPAAAAAKPDASASAGGEAPTAQDALAGDDVDGARDACGALDAAPAAAPVSPGTELVGALSAKDERVAGGAALALAAHHPPKSRRWPFVPGAGIGELDRISQNGVVRSAAYAAAAMLVDGGMPLDEAIKVVVENKDIFKKRPAWAAEFARSNEGRGQKKQVRQLHNYADVSKAQARLQSELEAVAAKVIDDCAAATVVLKAARGLSQEEISRLGLVSLAGRVLAAFADASRPEDKDALCGGLREALTAHTISQRQFARRVSLQRSPRFSEPDRLHYSRFKEACDALFDALTAVRDVLDQAVSFGLPEKPSSGFHKENCARLLAAAADAISHLAARLLFIGSAAHGPSDAASAAVVAEMARGDAVVATPPRVVDALSDSLESVNIGRSAAADDMFTFWRALGCDEKTARLKLREDAWLLHFEGPRKLRETALATVPAKRRGRARLWVHAKTGVRLYPLEKVPEAVKHLRRAWSQTPPEWERLPDAMAIAFNLDASRYVARRKGSALDVSEMVRLGARFGPPVRATLKPLSKPPWRCLTRNCPSVVARRVGRRALASSSASRASVVALGADERRAAGAPFLRHAGGRAAAASFASLACASSSALRTKIDVIEHILRFVVGADPLNFVMALDEDAQHARGLAADASFLRHKKRRAAAASFLAAKPSKEGAGESSGDEELTGESSDDEVGSLPDGGVADMPSLARGTLSRPRAPPRSDPTPEVATEPEPAAEPEPEPGPASWVQCVACDKWRVVDADTAVLAASSSWTCADGGVTCTKMACSADNPDCECHRRDWNREVLLVSPTGCVLAQYCSPRSAGAAHGWLKQTVEACCHVSASKTKNVFRYASGFKEELLRYEVGATMDRMIAEVSRADERAVVAELQQRIVSLELENAYLHSLLGPVAPKRRGHKRRRVHHQPLDLAEKKQLFEATTQILGKVAALEDQVRNLTAILAGATGVLVAALAPGATVTPAAPASFVAAPSNVAAAIAPAAPQKRRQKRRRGRPRGPRQRQPADSETANAVTRNWRKDFLKIARDAPPVPFQMPPPPPTVPPEAAPH